MSRRTPEALLLTLLAACGSAPEPAPLVPPVLETGVRYFPGTVLTGARPIAADAAKVPFDHALDVRCNVSYVERMPWNALDAMATRTRLIVHAYGDDPLLPATDLAVGARIGSGEAAARFLEAVADGSAAGRSVPVFELRGAVPLGATAAFYSRSIDTMLADDGSVVRKAVTLMVGREDDGSETTLALAFEDIGLERAPFSDDDEQSRSVHKREIVLLEDVPAVDGAPIAIAIPSLQDPSGERAYVVDVSFRTPTSGDPAFESAKEHCIADLSNAGEKARVGGMSLEDAERSARSIARGLRALDLARNHRPALAFLAGQSANAPLALDLALSGDDATLAAWARRVEDADASAPVKDDSEATSELGWLLERTAYSLLAGRLDRDELSIELRGMLARHAGEAGQFPGLLTGLLGRAPDRGTFVQMIHDENVGFLEAPDPAARVRAFDWLRARGDAPEGYDPLADLDARRDALIAYREARAEAAR